MAGPELTVLNISSFVNEIHFIQKERKTSLFFLGLTLVNKVSAQYSFLNFPDHNMIPTGVTDRGSCAAVACLPSLEGACYLGRQPSDALSLLHKSINELMRARKRTQGLAAVTATRAAEAAGM